MMINNVHSGAMVGLLSISVFLIATGNSKSDCSLSSADPGDASDVVSDVTGGSDMDSPQPDAAADAKPEELEVAIEPELGVCTVKAVHPVTCMCTVKQKCSDGKYWTTDSCDEVTGECTYIDPYTCPTSQGCDDGNACTIDCDDPLTGQCVHLGKNCDDSDVCTEDSCDFVSGECKHSGPNDMYGGCGEFLSLCLENTCDPVKMLCGVKPKCDDGNLCTADSCDEGTGTCSFVPGPDCVGFNAIHQFNLYLDPPRTTGQPGPVVIGKIMLSAQFIGNIQGILAMNLPEPGILCAPGMIHNHWSLRDGIKRILFDPVNSGFVCRIPGWQRIKRFPNAVAPIIRRLNFTVAIG